MDAGCPKTTFVNAEEVFSRSKVGHSAGGVMGTKCKMKKNFQWEDRVALLRNMT